MGIKKSEAVKELHEVSSEESLIRNAVIDLLHYDQEVTYETISEATGISRSNLQHHHDAIRSMLIRLKKSEYAHAFTN